MNIFTNNFTPALYFNKLTATKPVQNNAVNFKGKLNQLEQDSFELSKPQSQKVEYGTIHYLKNKKFDCFEFDKPQTFSEALKKIKELQEKYKLCKYGLADYNYVYESYDDAYSNKFKNLKFKKFLGAGNNAMALETDDGKVVKFGEANHFALRNGEEDFDAKIYEKGKVGLYHHYYIQEKCSKEGITQENVEQIRKQIEEKGYDAIDLFDEQVGFSKDGKLCLIDPECARDKEKFEKMHKETVEWMLKNGLDMDYI